jgi:hypothetical protein
VSAFLSMFIEDCNRKRHHFVTAGSDKTPLKLNLICVTCTDANPGKTAYVAYGVEHGSFGQWRRRKNEDDEA